MQVVKRYKCDVCGREYATEDAAAKCEETCGYRYMYYMLAVVPFTGTAEFSKRPTGVWDSLPGVEMDKSLDICTNDKLIFHLTRPRNSGFTEDEARRLLVNKAQEWLGKLSKEIDKILYFQM